MFCKFLIFVMKSFLYQTKLKYIGTFTIFNVCNRNMIYVYLYHAIVMKLKIN